MSDVKWTKEHQQAWHRNKILVYHVAKVGNRMVKILRSKIGEVFVYCYEMTDKGWVRSDDPDVPGRIEADPDDPYAGWHHFSTVKVEKEKAEAWLMKGVAE